MTAPEIESYTVVPRSRVEGAFTALAAGDALGWPQEFMSRKKSVHPTASFQQWERRGGGRYFPYTEIIRAGEYSDDTQLTLAVARSRLMAGSSWWSYFTRNELPFWIIYERGGGGATKRAANSWLRGVAPWRQDVEAVARYFEAGGNGVAMRVVPHAVFHTGTDEPTALIRDVVLDGAATHGHPRALIGAAVYAYAAWWLLRAQQTVGFGELFTVLLDATSVWGALPVASATKNGWLDAANASLRNYQKLWDSVVEEMCQLLEQGRRGIGAGVLSDDREVLDQLGAFGREKGSGTVSAAAAIYLASRYAAQPLQGVLRAAFAIGSDTDTVAAMTGGLLGALGGSDWQPPEWEMVQDIHYLRRIANQLAARESLEVAYSEHPVTSKALDSIVESLQSRCTDDLDLGGARRGRVIDLYKLTPSSPSIKVAGWQLATSDGQTIYIIKVGRKSKGEMAQGDGSRQPSEPQGKQPLVRGEQNLDVRAGGVKLAVKNLAASSAFYDYLGLVPTKRSKRFVQYGALSLVDAQAAVDLSDGIVSLEPATRRNRIELHVGDIRAAHERVTALAVGPVYPINELPWGERSFHCIDPDGNIIEVIQKRSGKDNLSETSHK